MGHDRRAGAGRSGRSPRRAPAPLACAPADGVRADRRPPPQRPDGRGDPAVGAPGHDAAGAGPPPPPGLGERGRRPHPEEAHWAWAECAVELGASPTTDPLAADVVAPDGRPAWCDGGPLRHPDDLGTALAPPVVLHRLGLESGSLRPLGPNVAAGSAATLAADQRAAVTHPSGAARIIAPAGSGKTRVLTERGAAAARQLGPASRLGLPGRLQPAGGRGDGRADLGSPQAPRAHAQRAGARHPRRSPAVPSPRRSVATRCSTSGACAGCSTAW